LLLKAITRCSRDRLSSRRHRIYTVRIQQYVCGGWHGYFAESVDADRGGDGDYCYSRAYLSGANFFSGEFISLIFLFATLGMIIIDGIVIFCDALSGPRAAGIVSYALVALNRDSAKSTEAAMKYFFYFGGRWHQELLLYGISMIYGATGSLDVSTVAAIVSNSRANDPLLTFGLVFIIGEVTAFKELGAVPFHVNYRMMYTTARRWRLHCSLPLPLNPRPLT
jgi:hypothetical protein